MSLFLVPQVPELSVQGTNMKEGEKIWHFSDFNRGAPGRNKGAHAVTP
mgnify:CR=1 FL=1